jgi:hypothetical protein
VFEPLARRGVSLVGRVDLDSMGWFEKEGRKRQEKRRAVRVLRARAGRPGSREARRLYLNW